MIAADAQSTHQRLIEIAIAAFGRAGRDGVSTRELAELAGTPMSSITYHFGGKDGLYLAAARHIATVLSTRLAPLLAGAREQTQTPGDERTLRHLLHKIIAGMLVMMVADENKSLARFILREQADPTDAFEILFGEIMRPVITRISEILVLLSRGTMTKVEANVRSTAIFGQLLVFEMARAAVLRATGWPTIGDDERTQLQLVVADHLDGILDRICASAEREAAS